MPSKSNSRRLRQKGGRVTMPAEYYGGNSGRYFPEGSPELVPADHAYGKTVATSHGIPMEGNQMGPNLGPYPGSSGTQTGGSRKQKGGRVTMPAEYYGGNSGRYFPEGSAELVPCNGAYGKTVATSHGTPIEGNQMGPNLSPYPGSSGILTGGARKRKSKSKSKSRSGKKSRRSSSKSKSRSGKKSRRSSSKSKSRSGKRRRSSSKSRSGKKKRSSRKSKSVKKSRGRKRSRSSKSKSRSRSGKKSRGKKSSSSRRRRRLSSRSKALRRREKRLSSRSRRVRRRERRLSSTARRMRNKKRSVSTKKTRKGLQPGRRGRFVDKSGQQNARRRKRSYGYAEPTYGDRY